MPGMEAHKLTPMEQRRQQTDNVERRAFCGEVRAIEQGSRRVVGYAAMFNKRSGNLGGFVEVIKPGAFTNVLKNGADVRALLNHDPNMILARTPGTLTLTQDEIGLRYEFDAPNTQAGNDLLESIQRGDIRESSFAFSLTKEGQKWSKDENQDVSLREINEVSGLFDVSPVTYPAYPDTTVAKRSMESWATEQTPENPDDSQNEIYKRLQIALEAKMRAITN